MLAHIKGKGTMCNNSKIYSAELRSRALESGVPDQTTLITEMAIGHDGAKLQERKPAISTNYKLPAGIPFPNNGGHLQLASSCCL
jgi:hypothetical protein